VWTGEIYMGKFTPMDVVFDTGSDWVVIKSDQCESCVGDRYDLSSSVIVNDEISTRQYGSAFFKGKEYKDTVCILLSACAFNFEYFAIFEERGFSHKSIDGILGLGRSNSIFMDSPDGLRESGPLFLAGLVDQGIIDEMTVSFYFTGQFGNAAVDFGKPQISAMRKKSELVYITMLDDFFWSAFN
jgi:hypothetical protein